MSDIDVEPPRPLAPVSSPGSDATHDAEARLTPEFVDAVVDRVEEGDIEGARALVAPLHPADIADLFELAPGDRSPGCSTPTSSPR